MNFLRTVRSFFRQSYVNPYWATARHVGWQARKLADAFPHDVRIGEARIRIANRVVANGCGAQLNALGYFDGNNMRFIRTIFQGRVFTTFFDVGANIGAYSIIVATACPEARIVAFEPHPQTFALLEENIALNSAQERIHALNTALSDFEGEVDLSDMPGSPENRILDGTWANRNAVRVACQRGDGVCARLGLVPEVMKIDVEGHEARVLAGFAGVLADVCLLLVESKDVKRTQLVLSQQSDFRGPFKIDFRSRRFVANDIHGEDWLFVNRRSVPALEPWL